MKALPRKTKPRRVRVYCRMVYHLLYSVPFSFYFLHPLCYTFARNLCPSSSKDVAQIHKHAPPPPTHGGMRLDFHGENDSVLSSLVDSRLKCVYYPLYKPPDFFPICFLIRSIIFVFPFSLSSSVDRSISDRVTKQALLLLSATVGVPLFFWREDFRPFFPRRLARNCAYTQVARCSQQLIPLFFPFLRNTSLLKSPTDVRFQLQNQLQ